MDPIDSAVIPDSLPPFAQDHARRYRDTNGRDGHLTAGGRYPEVVQNVPSLLLATKGRESGRCILVPLFYGIDAGRYVVVAAGGDEADDNPGWFKNLCKDPDVRIQVGAQRLDAVASLAEGAERERLWQLMEGIYDGFGDFAEALEHDIPIVVLAPRQH
jgi:deazaflavin-dependent oxidoreductase (nitroreductase family)